VQTVVLGRTGLTVNKNGFGALPIQRIPRQEAVYLLRKAADNGINFFDTARRYTDSEEKMGEALAGRRSQVIIGSKTGVRSAAEFWNELHQSLSDLRTDYLDLYQFHNPDFCPRPGDGSGLYDAMLEARQQGKIRFIGLTNHRLAVARECVESGLYDTLQFPFSYLASQPDLDMVEASRSHSLGFIAMKALSGGLITNSAAAYAYLAQYDHVLPIWGIQRENELDEFLSYHDNPPAINAQVAEQIALDRQALAGDFCRGCGYCMPCPAGIEISNCARMIRLLERSPRGPWLSESWQREMKKIEDCLECGQCKAKCPYELDTPALLRKNYEIYCQNLR
jgi:uncharacterized protein